jgi:hypothetical protein
LKVVVGTESVEDYKRPWRQHTRLLYFDPNYVNLSTGTPTKTIVAKAQHRLFSEFARLDYALITSTCLTATIRRDGSSKFSVNQRYGYFPHLAQAGASRRKAS